MNADFSRFVPDETSLNGTENVGEGFLLFCFDTERIVFSETLPKGANTRHLRVHRYSDTGMLYLMKTAAALLNEARPWTVVKETVLEKDRIMSQRKGLIDAWAQTPSSKAAAYRTVRRMKGDFHSPAVRNAWLRSMFSQCIRYYEQIGSSATPAEYPGWKDDMIAALSDWLPAAPTEPWQKGIGTIVQGALLAIFEDEKAVFSEEFSRIREGIQAETSAAADRFAAFLRSIS